MCKDNVIRNQLPKYVTGTEFVNTLNALATFSAIVTETSTPGIAVAAQSIQYPTITNASDRRNSALTVTQGQSITGSNDETRTGADAVGATPPNKEELIVATYGANR